MSGSQELKRRLAWPSSPNTTPGPNRLVPRSRASVPRIIESRVVLPAPLRPRIPSRSPHPISRSIGPRCQSPRRTTCSLEAGDDITASGRGGDLELEAPGLEGLFHLCSASEGSLGRADLRRLFLGPVDAEVRVCALSLSFGFLAAFATPRHRPLALLASAGREAAPARCCRRGGPPPHGAAPSPEPRGRPASPPGRCVSLWEPGSISAIEVTMRSRNARSCETTTRPPARRSRKSSSRSRPSKSRSLVGSSKSTMSNRDKSSAASAALAAWPPESCDMARLNSDGGKSRGSAQTAPAAGLEVRATEGEVPLEGARVGGVGTGLAGSRGRRPPRRGRLEPRRPRFASPGTRRRSRPPGLAFLGQVAHGRRREANGSRCLCRPGRGPASIRSSVVFPTPLGPSTPRRVPGPTARLTDSRTTWAPRCSAHLTGNKGGHAR